MSASMLRRVSTTPLLDDVAADAVDTVHLARRLDGDGAKAWATVEERG